MKDKTIRILGISFLLIIPLHKLIESFISNIFVSTIFNKITSSIPNDIVAFLLVIFLTYSLVLSLKRNVYISWNHIFIWTGLLITYVYYRYFGNIWSFVRFETAPKLTYSDLFLLFVVFEWVKKICYKSEETQVEPEKGFLFDNPIKGNGNDELKRKDYAISICEKINNTKDLESAFSIGLNGNWGAGKTSFLNLIRDNLSESDYIIFEFNPWQNNGASSIINEFFKLLSIKVNKYNSDLSKKIELYGKLLLQFGDSKLNKVVNPILHLNSLNNVAQTQYKEINTSISKLKKKLIIFIDDLDRLDNYEIIEVLRIIRNTANFGNTVFITAYDRNYVINALKKINVHNSEFFLEKIFQVEVNLPEYETETIKRRLFDSIKNNLTSKHKEQLNSLFFDKKTAFILNRSHNYSDNIIRTIRDVTRFANSFNLLYSNLNIEVNIIDLYYLELIRLKYPGVYSLIFQERDIFLTLTDEKSLGVSYRDPFYSLKTFKKKKSEEKNDEIDYEIEYYLKENTSNIGIHKKSIPSIIDILKILFPEKFSSYDEQLEPLSLADPKCFDRYFQYRLSSDNLSQAEFDKYLNKSSEDCKNKMLEWVSNGLRREISDKFRQIKDFEDREKFEKAIGAIFNFARIPEQKHIENDFAGYPYTDLIKMLKDFKVSLYKEDQPAYFQFLKSIFDNAPSPYKFETSLIRNVLKTFDYGGFDLDKEYLDKLCLKYFSEYLKSIEKIDDTAFYLYVDVLEITEKESNPFQKAKIHSEVNNIFKQFIKKKDLDGFLFKIIQPPRLFKKQKGYGINKLVLTLFGGFAEFKAFLDEFEIANYEYLEEFLNFYEELKKSKNKNDIEFDFEKIPIVNKSTKTQQWL